MFDIILDVSVICSVNLQSLNIPLVLHFKVYIHKVAYILQST
jgi:hypothetical protein